MNLVTKRQVSQAENDCRTLPAALSLAPIVLVFASLAACQTAVEYQAPAVVVTASGNQPEGGADSKELINATPSEFSLKSDYSDAGKASAPWLSTVTQDFALAKSLVEDELSVDLTDITLSLVEDAPINAEVALETQRLVHEQFGNSSFADMFLQQIMGPLDGTYAALYSSRLSAVMISRSMLASYERSLLPQHQGSTKRAALLTLLIHELVHAADDKRYQIHDNRALNFRASFAQSATFEGHAQWVTRKICQKAGCSEGLEALDNFMFSTHQQGPQLTQAVEAISRSVLEYSYIEGERFVAALAKRDNGEQLVEELLTRPPLDPIQILAPETFPNARREHLNQHLISASRTTGHPLAAPPWIGVETSPLKGIDLRADPARRQAAVDGFTRLLQGMISMQFYDQTAPGAMPIEATILAAESSRTARLFANMLHSNTQQSGARVSDERKRIGGESDSSDAGVQMHIYRTAIDADTSYRTTIAVSGKHVVQVSGNIRKQTFLDEYATQVLLKLSET